MFSSLSMHTAYWKERLNVFIALAPVTRLHYTQSELFKLVSGDYNVIKTMADGLHIFSVFGGFLTDGTKVICGTLPRLCKLAEGFLIT